MFTFACFTVFRNGHPPVHVNAEINHRDCNNIYTLYASKVVNELLQRAVWRFSNCKQAEASPRKRIVNITSLIHQ